MNIRHTPASVAAPFGPYSHAVEVPEGSRLLYISGEVGVLPDGRVPDAIDALLSIPAGWDSAAIIPLGWPDRAYGPNRRPPLDAVVCYDRWADPPTSPA